MSSYYQRLEADLAAAVPRRAAMAARSRRRRQRGLSALAAASIAAAGLVLALGTSGSGVSPAYAVVVKPDGSVALSVRELLGVGPANARLASLGVRARLVRREPGCATRVKGTLMPPGLLHTETRRAAPASRRVSRDRTFEQEAEQARAELRLLSTMTKPTSSGGRLGMVIEPAAIPHGYTLLLSFRTMQSSGRIASGGASGGSHAIGESIELAKGDAPSCLPAL